MREKIMKRTILIIISLSAVLSAVTSERLVPSQYPTIQAAIHVADNGETFTVEANTCQENIDFMGKAIKY